MLTLPFVNKIIPISATVLVTDYITIYAKIRLSISSVNVYNYPSAELTFVSLTFNIVTNRQQSYWASPRISKEVSPGRHFLIKVWFSVNYEPQKQLLQATSNIWTEINLQSSNLRVFNPLNLLNTQAQISNFSHYKIHSFYSLSYIICKLAGFLFWKRTVFSVVAVVFSFGFLIVICT